MVTLLDVKMRVPAGAPVVWNDYPRTDGDQVATVMMPGPVASSVWAVSQFGSWLCLRWYGKRQAWLNVTGAHADALVDQRARVVVLAVEAEYRRGQYGRYAFPVDREWSREAAELHRVSVRAELRVRLWAQLYPGVTPTD